MRWLTRHSEKGDFIAWLAVGLTFAAVVPFTGYEIEWCFDFVGWAFVNVSANHNLEAKLTSRALIAAKYIAIFGPTPHIQTILSSNYRREIVVGKKHGSGVLEAFGSDEAPGSSFFALTPYYIGKIKIFRHSMARKLHDVFVGGHVLRWSWTGVLPNDVKVPSHYGF
jgi:hypothetical protein